MGVKDGTSYEPPIVLGTEVEKYEWVKRHSRYALDTILSYSVLVHRAFPSAGRQPTYLVCSLPIRLARPANMMEK